MNPSTILMLIVKSLELIAKLAELIGDADLSKKANEILAGHPKLKKVALKAAEDAKKKLGGGK